MAYNYAERFIAAEWNLISMQFICAIFPGKQATNSYQPVKLIWSSIYHFRLYLWSKWLLCWCLFDTGLLLCLFLYCSENRLLMLRIWLSIKHKPWNTTKTSAADINGASSCIKHTQTNYEENSYDHPCYIFSWSFTCAICNHAMAKLFGYVNDINPLIIAKIGIFFTCPHELLSEL